MNISNKNKPPDIKLNLEVVSLEKVVFSGKVDQLVVPGINGQLGILPQHCPLISLLNAGEMKISRDGKEICLDLSGGFLMVKANHVIILADLPIGKLRTMPEGKKYLKSAPS